MENLRTLTTDEYQESLVWIFKDARIEFQYCCHECDSQVYVIRYVYQHAITRETHYPRYETHCRCPSL